MEQKSQIHNYIYNNKSGIWNIRNTVLSEVVVEEQEEGERVPAVALVLARRAGGGGRERLHLRLHGGRVQRVRVAGARALTLAVEIARTRALGALAHPVLRAPARPGPAVCRARAGLQHRRVRPEDLGLRGLLRHLQRARLRAEHRVHVDRKQRPEHLLVICDQVAEPRERLRNTQYTSNRDE